MKYFKACIFIIDLETSVIQYNYPRSYMTIKFLFTLVRQFWSVWSLFPRTMPLHKVPSFRKKKKRILRAVAFPTQNKVVFPSSFVVTSLCMFMSLCLWLLFAAISLCFFLSLSPLLSLCLILFPYLFVSIHLNSFSESLFPCFYSCQHR